MDYQFPLVATHREGNTRIFDDAESFRAFAFDRANGGVGAYWMEGYTYYGSVRLFRIHNESTIRERWYKDCAKNTWIVRDNRGRVVDKKDFYVPYVWPHGYLWSAERQHAAENNLPIPGTGKRRWHRKSSSVKGRNGAHNRRKGIKLFEDPLIKSGNVSEL